MIVICIYTSYTYMYTIYIYIERERESERQRERERDGSVLGPHAFGNSHITPKCPSTRNETDSGSL